MITNKDLSIDSENGKITLNGNKYDLGTQGEIDTAVKDVYTVMGKLGAKNLLVPKWTETQTTENGITYTFNADGTIIMNTDASGATADTNCNLKNIQASTDNIYPAGTYKLSGCPSGGSGTTYRTWTSAYRPGDPSSSLTGSLYDEGNGVTFTVNETFQLAINLTVRKNYVCNNLTWKPMIRYASDTDNTYEPYAMTNKQLTEQVADVKGTIGDLTQTGVSGASVAAQLAAVYGNITPQTSGEWKWIELPGNLVIMWCNHSFGEIGDLVQEGPFYKANVTRLTYPITFVSAPGVWAQKIGNGQGLIIGTGDGGTTTQTPDFTIGRYTSSTLIYGCTLAYLVVGIKATT